MSHKTYALAGDARDGFCKSFDRKTRYSNDQIATNDRLHEMGLLEPLTEVLKLIEQHKPNEAHRTLDGLINPRYRSRAAHLQAHQILSNKESPYGGAPAENLDEELAILLLFALPFIEEAADDPVNRSRRIKPLITRIRAAIQAVEASWPANPF